MSSDIPADIKTAFEQGRIPSDISLAFLAESKDYSAIVGIWFVVALATVIFALRLLVRLVLRPAPGLDDLLALGTLLCYIAFAVLCHILINLGSARHFAYIQYVVPLYLVERTEVLDFAAHLIYTTALYLCRLSGLSFYSSRIIGRSTAFTWTIRIVTVFLTLAYIPQMLLILLHCIPVTGLWPYSWQPGVENYTCLQWGTVYATNSAVSLVSDLALFSIPVAIIASLKRLSDSKKVKLGAVLMPGVAVIAISIARLVLVIQGQWQPDESWYYGPLLAIESAEIGSTLIALSAPALHPLFRSWKRRAGRRLSLARSSRYGSKDSAGAVGNADGYYGNAGRSTAARRWWSSIMTGARADDSDDEDSSAPRSQPSPRMVRVNEGWSHTYGDRQLDEKAIGQAASTEDDEVASADAVAPASASYSPKQTAHTKMDHVSDQTTLQDENTPRSGSFEKQRTREDLSWLSD
ncbi:hypothetical protein FH972_023053 [Carpinus fangiana]|uniref:Rhodopsin domain-containing protein n=1 Tax=Carpinus fangiana TaxID=176857 RepID=A0A5N6KU23_9ROSI|nr:hypothetical protein FH972_023053 [Carpinus fangiana]